MTITDEALLYRCAGRGQDDDWRVPEWRSLDLVLIPISGTNLLTGWTYTSQFVEHQISAQKPID
jgi:hypothetical protein